MECSGGGAAPPATLAEFTLNGAGGLDFYDVSLVDGYNLPMLLALTSATPDTCKPTSYSEFFKTACPRAYSYAYDDGTSTFTCAGADYLITFCPSPITSLKSSKERKNPEAAGASAGDCTTSPSFIGGATVLIKYKSPDCYRKLVVTINGKFSGPTIFAKVNDTVVVEVNNSLLTDNLAIHWHGIRQIGTPCPWFDEKKGVSRCPIQPGNAFKYEFVVDRPGTYLYHSHYGMQREAGLYGSIRVSVPDVESEPFSYDYDRSIILNDWYHKSTYEQATGLGSIPFNLVEEPQSLLIQEKRRFDCSTPGIPAGVCNATNPECCPYVMTVVPGKTYRLRIASLTELSVLSFQIEGHNMTVVEADGHYVEPFVVENLFIYSGETYSVLVRTDQDPSMNYWMTSTVVSRQFNTPQGLAIFNYYPNNPHISPPTPGPIWNDVAPRLNQGLAISINDRAIKVSQSMNRRRLLRDNLINGTSIFGETDIHWEFWNFQAIHPYFYIISSLSILALWFCFKLRHPERRLVEFNCC